MGHSTVAAAMVYQHATDGRDQEIADKLAGLVDKYWRVGDERTDDAAGPEPTG